MLRKKLDYEKTKIQKRHVQIGEVSAKEQISYHNFDDSSKIFTHFETFLKIRIDYDTNCDINVRHVRQRVTIHFAIRHWCSYRDIRLIH